MKRFIYDIFRIIKKKEYLFILFNKMYLPRNDHDIIPRKDYLLCIYSYPSSANTFSYYYIKNLIDVKSKISHHMHAPSMISRALRLNLPVIIIIREPLHAIASIIYALVKEKRFQLTLLLSHIYIFIKKF